ncbi:helix-hairpin-helix domain-containing protein [Leucobacter sp. BZR 635]
MPREEAPGVAGGGRWRTEASAGPVDPEALSWAPTPTLLQRLTSSLSLPATVGIALFVVAIAVTAVIMLRGLAGSTDSAAAHVGVADGESESLAAGAGDPGEDSISPAAADAAGEPVAVVMVHVIGEVRRPGVVEVPASARVLDAIEAAGGATEGADLSALNLARQIGDGEQIAVLDVEAAALLRDAKAAAGGDVGGADSSSAGTGADAGASQVVNVNTASAEELTQLSGIGPALAQRIIDWRSTNGRFESVDQLLEVSGIGQKTLDRFRERVGV